MQERLIEWREEFRIGLPEVDEEHRSMIAALNRLHRELVVGVSAVRVAGALGAIHSEISAHFALEERDMSAMGYAEYGLHKGDHERLLDEIMDILDEVVASGCYDPATLSSRLSAWFAEHFRSFDARLHRWLAGRG